MGNPCTQEDLHFFYASTTITLGNGSKTPFRDASWLLGRKPMDIASLIFEASWRKHRKVREALKDNVWIFTINHNTVISGAHIWEFFTLWMLLREVRLDDFLEDDIVWKHSSDGIYSSSTAYKAQFLGMTLSPMERMLSRACKQPDTLTSPENVTAKHMDHSKNCGHGLTEIVALIQREQELVTQLRALILPQLHNVDSRSAELAVQLFDDVIGCSTSVVTKLFSAGSGSRATIEVIDDKSLVRKNSTSTAAADIDDKMEEQARPSSIVGRKRRRNDDKQSRSLVTNAPHYDGHQWRKYGQKNINGRQHARSYYRCTYTERNCSATKTVQQQDQDGGSSIYSTDDCEVRGAKYTVVYYGDHTCKDGDNISNNIIDHLPNLVDIDLPRGETERVTEEISEFEVDLDVPALLEVFNNSQLNWEIVC
ncbi:uncharacterized protein LOC123396661 [Hordeum vulgare subsp. vulgare]|nr:uncharacterized protein LOC123396661 [Hordeum vulgare subsp. vulgare]